MKKVAVILAGCGHRDGSEIREAVITLLELDKHNAKVQIFAPNKEQYDVINHLDGSNISEKRNILIEAARIARGDIKELKEAKSSDFDALILPGGFGVAKNLADIAQKGNKGEPIPEIKKLINDFISEHKPIGAICISPAIVASAIKDKYKATLTLGEKNELLDSFGANQKECDTINYILDEQYKIVCTPAYMKNDRLANIAKGIEQLINKVMQL